MLVLRRLRYAATWVVLSALAVPAVPAVAAETPAVTRRDVATAYVAFDRGMIEHPPAGEARAGIVRRFDRMTHLAFRGRLEAAADAMLDLTDDVLPADPADRAARSLRVTATPGVFVAGEDGTLALRWLRSVDDAPPLTLRLRRDDGEEAVSFATDPAGADQGTDQTWHLPADTLATGHYSVEAVTPAGRAWAVGALDVVARRPSELRERLLAELDNAPTQDPALRRSLLALRSRVGLLRDDPDPSWPASFLANLADLERELPREADALLAGRDPYANRPGDYWRTFDAVDGPPLSLPARVYAPPAAMDKIARGDRVPLVITLHGAGGDENLFMDGYGAGELKRLADRYGFVAVSPATERAMFDLRSPGVIVDAVSALYPTDAGRVYVVGHSLGAMLAGLWAGQLPDRWAGVGMIAGGKPGAQLVPAGGGRAVAVPVVVASAGYDTLFPPASQHASAAAARAAGARVTEREYPAEGHVSVVGAALPDVIAALLAP